MSGNAGGDKPSVFQFDPTPDLIPDEYDIDVQKASVHFFVSQKDEYNCGQITDVLQGLGYPVVQKYPLKKKAEVESELTNISNANYENKSCLMLFVMGRATKDTKSACVLTDTAGEEISIQDVWKACLCPSLRNKPKLIYFQAERPRTTTDSVVVVDGKYDVPVQADLLIIYKLSQEKHKNAFISSFCENIEQRGERDDVIDLITHSRCPDERPLLISTLTRRLYLRASNKRGYDYDIQRSNNRVLEIIKKCTYQLQPDRIRPLSIVEMPVTPAPAHKSAFSSWPELNKLQEEEASRTRKKSVSTQNKPRRPWKP